MQDPVTLSPRVVKRAACDRCHVLKSRCSRSSGKNEACDRCRRLGIECVSSAPLRTGRPRGSGLGMQSGSRRRSKSAASVVLRSRIAVSQERHDSSASPANQPTIGLESEETRMRHGHSMDSTIPHTAAQFSHLSHEAMNLAESEFSSSSLDGKNAFDWNSYTPMTTSLEDLTIEPSLYPPNYQAWSDSGTEQPGHLGLLTQTNQQYGMTSESSRALEQNAMFYNSSSIIPIRTREHDNLTYTGHVQSEAAVNHLRDDPRQFLMEHMSILFRRTHQLQHFVTHSKPVNPLLIIDDLLKMTKTMSNILFELMITVTGGSATLGNEVTSSDWEMSTATGVSSLPRDFPNYVDDPRFYATSPFVMQLASSHAHLLYMYGPLVSCLAQKIQGEEQSELPTTQTIPQTSLSRSSSLSGLGTTVWNPSVSDSRTRTARQAQQHLRMIHEALRKLHTGFYQLLLRINVITTQQESLFQQLSHEINTTVSHSSAAALAGVLKELLLQEEPLLTELQSLPHAHR